MDTYYLPVDGIYGYGTNNGGCYLRFVVDRTYNPVTNISNLKIRLQACGVSGVWGGIYYTVLGSISISDNGGAASTLQTFSGNYNVAIGTGSSAGTWSDMKTGQTGGSVAVWEHNLAHNADGSASITLSISNRIQLNRIQPNDGKQLLIPQNGVSGSCSKSFSEPRASTISSCSSSAATNGNISLSMNRASTLYYHVAVVTDSGGRTMSRTNAFATSVSIPVNRSCFDNYTTSTSFIATVTVQTYTDSSCSYPVGNPVTANVTITADAGMVPTINTGFVTVQQFGNPSGITGYIQGISRAQVILDESKVSYANHASLVSYTVVCQNYTSTGTGTTYNTNVLTGTSAIPVSITVKDSRERTTSTQVNLTPILEYAVPTISNISVFRCNSEGSSNEDGTYISVKATAGCSSLNNPNAQNTVSLKVKYRASGGAWSAETTLTSGTVSIIGGSLDPDKSYEVLLTATDKIPRSTEKSTTISTRKWAMKFREDGEGVGFGKAPEHSGALEMPEGWNLWFGSHNLLGGYATGAEIIHYGGDNGVQLRIYGSDNTVYAISFYVNAIQLQTSTDGGNTWTTRWTK